MIAVLRGKDPVPQLDHQVTASKTRSWHDRSKMLYFYLHFCNWLASLLREEGQDLIEYTLLLGLLAITCLVAITFAGQSISQIWNTVVGILRIAIAGS